VPRGFRVGLGRATLATASEAINDAMLAFAAHGTPVSHFDIHAREQKCFATTTGWIALCNQHFAQMPSIETDTVRVASSLVREVFMDPDFEAAVFFDRLEASAAIAEYASGGLSFASADAFRALDQAIEDGDYGAAPRSGWVGGLVPDDEDRADNAASLSVGIFGS
jgi:hypothetical protein